ncbi:MAG TPA: hypothetical protein VGC34_04245 [Steroidobacteraceae bacterium]
MPQQGTLYTVTLRRVRTVEQTASLDIAATSPEEALKLASFLKEETCEFPDFADDPVSDADCSTPTATAAVIDLGERAPCINVGGHEWNEVHLGYVYCRHCEVLAPATLAE